MNEAADHQRPRIVQSAVVLATLIATAVLCFLLYWHLYLNGSRFHEFLWHRPPFWPLFPLIFLGAIPVFVAEALPTRWQKPAIFLSILMLSCLSLQWLVATLQWNQLSVAPIIHDIRDPMATSFFDDAQDLIARPVPIREFLRTYPERLEGFHYHAHNKGPLTILFYYAILRIFDDPVRSALAAAIAISLLATLAVPATWFMIRALTQNEPSARCGAAAFVLMPAVSIFLPEFDQLYVPLTALLIGAWIVAIRTNRALYSILAAIAISVTCLFAFNTLVIGAFLIGITLLNFRRPVWRQLPIAVATVVLFYLVLYLITGYRPIATLLECWRNQNINLKSLGRPWPDTIAPDLWNFLIDFAWMPIVPIAAFLLVPPAALRKQRALAIVCLAEPVLIAVTGLLQSETTRLWLFMTPLVVLVLGLEISRWSRPERYLFYACQTLLLAFVTQNLRFH